MWVCRLSHVSQGLCLCVANVIRVQSARETGSGICTSPTPDGARRRSVLPGSASSWGDPIFDASRALSGKGSAHRTHAGSSSCTPSSDTRRRAGRRRQRPSAMRIMRSHVPPATSTTHIAHGHAHLDIHVFHAHRIGQSDYGHRAHAREPNAGRGDRKTLKQLASGYL